jgi:hypothetical protein
LERLQRTVINRFANAQQGNAMPGFPKRRLYRGMTLVAAARRRIQQFGPYKSLAVLLVPAIIVEPVKMTGMAFVSIGHWFGGVCMIAGGYAAGFLVVDRLYRVVKSKLYTIPWCAALAAKVQFRLARWRWKRIVEPSPSDAVVIPKIEALESKLSR